MVKSITFNLKDIKVTTRRAAAAGLAAPGKGKGEQSLCSRSGVCALLLGAARAQGVALRIRHQMKTFLNAFRLRRLGWPVCNALPHAVEFFGDEVRCAEPFFSVLAALGQTDLFRTHEVPRIRAVLKTLGVY